MFPGCSLSTYSLRAAQTRAPQSPVALFRFALPSFVLPFMVPTDLCPVGFVKSPAVIPSSSGCLVCGILVVAPCGGEGPLPILSPGKLQQACPISVTVGPSFFFSPLCWLSPRWDQNVNPKRTVGFPPCSGLHLWYLGQRQHPVASRSLNELLKSSLTTQVILQHACLHEGKHNGMAKREAL